MSAGDSPADALRASGAPVFALIPSGAAAAADGPSPDATDGGEPDGGVPEHPASSTQPSTTTGHQRRRVILAT